MLCLAFHETSFFSPFSNIYETDFDIFVERHFEIEIGSTMIEFEFSIIRAMRVILSRWIKVN